LSHRYEDLIAWQKAKAFAGEIYRVTETFSKTEVYGLTSQLRRAGVSVSSHIAEGQGRLTKGEFCHFLGPARGSLLELETQLAIAFDLDYLPVSKFRARRAKSDEVRKILNDLIESLLGRKSSQSRNSKPETRNL
jgi:four helix bundle protein